MKLWSAFAVLAVCVGSSISAGAAAPSRLAKPDVSSRVLRLHRSVLQLLPLIVKGGGRHDSTAASKTNVNCPGGGTLSVTTSASTASTSSSTSSGGTGSIDYTVGFTDCKTTDDTLGGSMTFTYTASASNGGSTNTITVAYDKTNVVLKSVSTEPIVMQGLTISTVATTPTGGGNPQTTTTASGNVSVNGNVFAYKKETIDGPPKP